MTEKPHGSGYFGEWYEDEHGLPAYLYTCDQASDPKAVSPVNPEWRKPTDHSHQIGNDRLVGVASNYGYIQVRQDEGGPKFLNDFDPENHRYAGGFGYLTDGKSFLSTYCSGSQPALERTFGIGYLRKKVNDDRYSVDQIVFAPFGDDPLMISQVTITNGTSSPADLRWIEYWDSQMYQFSNRSSILAMAKKNARLTPSIRRKFADRFAHSFQAIGDGAGIMAEKRFLGRRFGDKFSWFIIALLLSTIGKKFTGGHPVRPPVKEAAMEDLCPPPTFLVSLDAPADGMETNGARFFGNGGVEHPDGISSSLGNNLSVEGSESALLLERKFRLAPGESRTLYFAYGYIPEGVEINKLLSKYRENLPDLWKKSSLSWKKDRIELNIPDEPWVDRELIWHNYYLRSNLTFDSFYKEHILSQGHIYQYLLGFQGAARDPLQHAMPFIFSRPEIVKEIIRYTLKEVQPNGEIPYGVAGHGLFQLVPFRPSDQEMWLLWLASEYVLANRDTDFLNEIIPTYPIYGPKAGKEKVGDMLARCYTHFVEDTGVGKHGLMRLSNGDWNDGVILGNVENKQIKKVEKHAESVLNAAMAAYVLDLYGHMLAYAGQSDLAAEARQKAAAQLTAVHQQWADRWFLRAWLTPDLGWIGDEQLWLEPQPWAMISGAATPEQATRLIDAIDELLRSPSKIGAMILSQGVPQMPVPIGDLMNGGVWPSINGTLIWALAQYDGEMAWDEWKKNSLACHAQAYPEIWYGIWSGPDTYNSSLSRYPGQTLFDETLLTGKPRDKGIMDIGVNWTDFPVMNMHPHAWQLYTVPKLMGIEFSPEGVQLAPSIPFKEYEFKSPLLGVIKSKEGYSGWYAPKTCGKWQITLRLPACEMERYARLEVNGKEVPLNKTPDGVCQWMGENFSHEPMTWAIK